MSQATEGYIRGLLSVFLRVTVFVFCAVAPFMMAFAVCLAVIAIKDAMTPEVIGSPNPKKAPWYFFGPQEMLAYQLPHLTLRIAFAAKWSAAALVLVGLWMSVQRRDFSMKQLAQRALLGGAIIALPWFYTAWAMALSGF